MSWHRTLSSYDKVDDRPLTRPAKYARQTNQDGEATLGWLGGCWCGLPMGHDWPGKDDGAPHPRDMIQALKRKP